MVVMRKQWWPLALAWLLGGCGGPSGEGTSAAATVSGGGSASQTFSGLFQGSTVAGLRYRITTDGQVNSGVTDAGGGFRYTLNVDGDGVPVAGTFGTARFSIGNVTLGSTTLRSDGMRVTAFDLVDGSLADYRQRVENIEKYLCSFAAVPSQCDTVTITAADIAQRDAALGAMSLADLDNAAFQAGVAGWSAVDIAALDVAVHLDETKGGADAVRLGTATLDLGADSVVADGQAQVLARLTATDTDGAPLAGAQVRFQATAGSFDTATTLLVRKVMTDADGRAVAMLTAPARTATATVTASVGGRFQSGVVRFTPGPPDAGRSGITVNPATLAADGRSTARVTVLLLDANGNPVADGTEVTLVASAGAVTPARTTTGNGQALFTLTAPGFSGSGQVSVAEFPGLSAVTVPFGAPSASGKAAAITLSASKARIAVAGGGGEESSALSIQVLDAAGDPINETASGYGAAVNNLRVTMRTHPGGGERISGVARTAAGGTETVSDTGTILVRTASGSATVTLTSGTLPGVVEMQAQALDSDGATVLAGAVTSAITIASGEPHLITLTDAGDNGLVDLGEAGLDGVYCRSGSALVTDRHGNAVPDGTRLSLGLVDSVIHEGIGAIAKNSADLTLTNAATGFAADFASAAIVRNGGVSRAIQVQDRILIPRLAAPGDRSRFVGSIGGSVLGTGIEFLRGASDPATQSGLRYHVGAALSGGAVHGHTGGKGCDPASLTTGSTVTNGGIAPLRVTYPANRNTILNGCYGYDAATGDYSGLDSRHANPRSAQVLLLAAANGSQATTVEKGTFCFAGKAPYRLSAAPSALSAGATLTVTLEDAGQVRLPFLPVSCSFTESVDSSGALAVAVAAAATSAVNPVAGSTNSDGEAFFDVTVAGGGGGTPDKGQITCRAAGAVATVAVTVP